MACTELRGTLLHFQDPSNYCDQLRLPAGAQEAWGPAFCGYEGYLVASSVALLAYWVSGLVAVLAMEGLPTKDKRE